MKKLIFIMTLVIVVLLAVLVFVPTPAKKEQKVSSTQTDSESQLAVDKAKQLFQEKKDAGLDMENGPCLSEEIIPGWAVDVAHSPRKTVDNQPQNQCQSFRDGDTEHFVELDTQGNVIRVF